MSNFKLLLFLAFYFAKSICSAQEGHYYLTNHVPQTGTFENTNFKIVQDSKGILYIANNRGLILYDGKNWEFVETPEAVFSVAIDSADEVFIGGQGGFGKLTKSGEREFQFESLSDSLVSADGVFELMEFKGKIYFLNQKAIFIYDNGHVSDIRLKDADIFQSFLPLPNDMSVVTSNGRVLSIDEDLKYNNLGAKNPVSVSLSFLNPEKSMAIVCASGDGLYLFDSQMQKLDFNDGGLLAKLEFTSGVWLKGNILAIGTLERGVIFLDLNNKSLIETLDFESGLPDNQVFSMTRDKVENSLWISHPFGFTRVSPFLPFRSFGRFPGIKGKFVTAQMQQNGLYVGTTVGLFNLKEINDYTERIVYVPVSNKINKTDANSAGENEATEEQKKKRGLFGFLRKKNESLEEQNGENSAVQKKEVDVHLEKRIIKELRSQHYEYKKIEGIDSKVFTIIDNDTSAIVSGLGGIFEVGNKTTTPISTDPIQFAFKLKNREAIVASGAGGGVYFFEKVNKGWKSYSTFSEVEGFIQYIFQDSSGNLWLLGSDVAYRCKLELHDLVDMEFWSIENPFYSKNIGSEIDNKIWVLNSYGIYYFDEDSYSFKRSENFFGFKESPKRLLPGTNSTLWINDGHDWSPIGNSELDSKKIKSISLFNDVSFINYDSNSNAFWIITGDNDLYRMDYKDTLVTNHLPLLLKEIRTGVRVLPKDRDFKIIQNQNSLTFEFLKPDYDNLFKIEYRYKLDGLGVDWSSWSPDNKIVSFPYLPEGDYNLHFESRDVFGQITNVEPYNFEIIPPYWKRAWFYALEIVAFGGLFLLSFRLNRFDHKYKWLSRLLAFLTLILSVEFIQVVVEMKFQSSQSPVISFFIQVFIALVLLPIEGIVRKTVFKLETEEQIKDLNKRK